MRSRDDMRDLYDLDDNEEIDELNDMEETPDYYETRMREVVALRAGFRCSNRDCREHTPVVFSKKLGKKHYSGVDVLISAEVEGDPRYDRTMTETERRSVKNRIWLCTKCSAMIDQDVMKYPVSLLKEWKKDAEEYANRKLVEDIKHHQVFVNSKEDETAKTWGKRMFLEREDGKKLQELYVLPRYRLGDYIEIPKELDRMTEEEKKHIPKIGLNDYLDQILDGMVDDMEIAPISLVLGAPGTGKSCLFSYLLNREGVVCQDGRYAYAGKRVYLYRFSDLTKGFQWKKKVTPEGQEEDEDASEILKQMFRIMRGGDENANPEKDLKNTILFLDGFDECAASEAQRSALLQLMADKWGAHARIIITCRHEYISNIETLEKNISCISLQKMDISQIRQFIEKYEIARQEMVSGEGSVTGKSMMKKLLELFGIKNEESEENYGDMTEYITKKETDIYGIPIILYMMLALNLDQTYPCVAISGVYDRIFSMEGGIYERSMELNADIIETNKDEFVFDPDEEIELNIPEFDEEFGKDEEDDFEEDEEEDDFLSFLPKARFFDSSKSQTAVKKPVLDPVLRIDRDRVENYTQYLVRVSHEIALYIFSHKGEQDVKVGDLQQTLDEKGICFIDNNGNKLPLSVVFKKGTGKYINAPNPENPESTVRFIHKSMYEYFMADYIFTVMDRFYKEEDKVDGYENLHKMLPVLLKGGRITKEIEEFLSLKLEGIQGEFSLFEKAAAYMLKKGLTYHLEFYMDEEKENNPLFFSERIKVEADIFEQLIYLLQIFRDVKKCPCMFEDNSEIIQIFPKYLGLRHYAGQNGFEFDLSRMNLSGMNLSHMNLSGYLLHRIKGVRTNFQHSNLWGTLLGFSDLTGANFRYANLTYSKLKGTVLKDAAFTNADLTGTTPTAKELFDDRSMQIPWTRVIGYIPEMNTKQDIRVGDYYPDRSDKVLGRYMQEKREEREQWEKKPVKWRVLELRGNRALLVSEKILDVRRFCEESRVTSWKDSDIRKWLNDNENKDGFMKIAFNENETKRICRTLVEPDAFGDVKYETPQGEATVDSIFLLSGQEIYKYFAVKKEEGRNSSKLQLEMIPAVISMTRYAKECRTDGDRSENWWLRTVSSGAKSAMYVNVVGQVCAGGEVVEKDNIGVRPAMWIRLDNITENQPK